MQDTARATTTNQLGTEPARPKKAYFRPNLAFGDEVKLLVPLYQGTNETLLSCWKNWMVWFQLAARDESNFFCFGIAIFVNRAYHQYAQGYNFPILTTPQKISFSELGFIFWGSPLFLALLGHSHVRGISTLHFGPISTKLGGTFQAIKKIDPGWQRTRDWYLFGKR